MADLDIEALEKQLQELRAKRLQVMPLECALFTCSCHPSRVVSEQSALEGDSKRDDVNLSGAYQPRTAVT